MSETSSKKRPDFIAYAVSPTVGNGQNYTRIGVGFTLKNGGIRVLYDGISLSGQVALLDIDAEKPATLSYGTPTREADFEANMVRDAGPNDSSWTMVGAAYRQDGYVSILLDVVPTSGKTVLSPTNDHE